MHDMRHAAQGEPFSSVLKRAGVDPCLPSAGGQGPRTLYARLPDGTLAHVDTIATGTTGLSCPDCGSELRARKYRSSKTDHFYHLNTEECRSAGETAIHLLGKEIIASSNRLALPLVAFDGGKDHGFRSEVFVKGRWIDAYDYDYDVEVLPLDVASVRLEVYRDGIRPDLIVTDTKGRDLFVEILVTHRVGDEKKEVLRSRNNPTIEIDLSGLNRHASFDEVREAVLSHAPRSWLHNSAIEARAAKLAQHESKIQEQRRRKEEAERAEQMKWAAPAVQVWRAPAQTRPELWTLTDYQVSADALRRAGGDEILSGALGADIFSHDGSRSPFTVHPSIVQIELFSLVVINGVRSARAYYAKADREFHHVRGKGRVLKLPVRDTWDLSELITFAERRGFIKKRLKNAWGLHEALCCELEPGFSSAAAEIQRIMKAFIDIGCVGKTRPAKAPKYTAPTNYVVAAVFLRKVLG